VASYPGVMPEPTTNEILLVEYQKAQDSAEHHDNLVGSVTSLWLGSAVLIGRRLRPVAEPSAHPAPGDVHRLLCPASCHEQLEPALVGFGEHRGVGDVGE
jgi:hypothetical protein